MSVSRSRRGEKCLFHGTCVFGTAFRTLVSSTGSYSTFYGIGMRGAIEKPLHDGGNKKRTYRMVQKIF